MTDRESLLADYEQRYLRGWVLFVGPPTKFGGHFGLSFLLPRFYQSLSTYLLDCG
jgi:hypothetical protein